MTLPFKMKRFVRDYDKDVAGRHLDWMATFTDPDRRNLLKDNFTPAESLIKPGGEKGLLSLQLSDIHNYLAEDILKKVDAASMLNSLEARVPLLDYRLVPLVLSLPERYKIRRLTTKWLLKKIAVSYVPAKIVHRRKRGFTAPISQWLRQKDLIREFIVNPVYYQHELLDCDYVQRMFDAHISRTEDYARQLWLVFVFNYWLSSR
jgi:asparagine synthase (glutamine-hydrolysing)